MGRHGVTHVESMPQQVALHSEQISPVGLQRIGRQPSLDPQPVEISLNQRIQQKNR